MNQRHGMSTRAYRINRALIMLVFGAYVVLHASDAVGQSVHECPPISTGTIRRTVEYLTQEALQGRSTGSVGDFCASRFVSKAFHQLGVPPYLESYLQPVPLPTNWPFRGEPASAQNVVAALPGTCQGPPVVIGAHHDHLGTNPADTRGKATFFPGADDNASGVAALVRIAEIIRASDRVCRTIIFVTFTGEETFFQGSRRFLREMRSSGRTPYAMINIDMVGRLKWQPLQISGVGSVSSISDSLIEGLIREPRFASMPVEIEAVVRRGSDHVIFADENIPVLYVTTGTHSDHHETTDTPSRLDHPGIETVAQLIARVAHELAAARSK